MGRYGVEWVSMGLPKGLYGSLWGLYGSLWGPKGSLQVLIGLYGFLWGL